MPPVAVPVVRPAVIGVRPRSIIVARAVTVARSVIIRVRASGGSGGECTCSEAERQSGADTPTPRLHALTRSHASTAFDIISKPEPLILLAFKPPDLAI
jgi:hypothetical protein